MLNNDKEWKVEILGGFACSGNLKSLLSDKKNGSKDIGKIPESTVCEQYPLRPSRSQIRIAGWGYLFCRRMGFNGCLLTEYRSETQVLNM